VSKAIGRRTKIVSTLGPASSDPGVLAAMIRAGMDVARFNMSHGDHAQHERVLAALHEATERAGKDVTLLFDLRGPEVRLLLPGGGPLAVQPDLVIPLPATTWPGFAAAVAGGAKVLLADGAVVAEALPASGQEGQRLRFLSSGVLRDRSKVAIPGVRADLPPLAPQDLADIAFAVEAGADVFAMSFVQEASDILELRDYLQQLGSPAMTVAKIETRLGYQNLRPILSVCDGAMVARGDLGVECSFEEIPLMQKEILALCNRLGKPGITATEMLESMTRQPRPTRAEASDVFNAVLDGTDAVMLSGETAIGQYPVETIEAMCRIVLQAERVWADRWEGGRRTRALTGQMEGSGSGQITPAVAIADAAVAAGEAVRAAAIITPTRSGYTARMVSRLRPQVPVLAVSSHPATVSALRLSWGVEPLLSDEAGQGGDPVETALDAASAAGLIASGDMVVVTAGVPANVPGTTNMLQLRTIGEVVARGAGIAAAALGGHAAPAVTGLLRVVTHASELADGFGPGDIIATDATDASFVPFMRQAAAVLTVEGGLSSHAAVVCLSLGKPVIVGVRNALQLPDGETVTVDAAHGVVYRGRVQPG